MADAQSEMLDLSVALARKEAAGQELSAAERAVSDVLWVDAQVSPNGFDGWLAYTTCEQMRRTIDALGRIGCARVGDIVQRALKLAGVEPATTSDDGREDLLDSLTDADRERLYELDDEFYEAVGDCMAACREFVRAHQDEFPPSSG